MQSFCRSSSRYLGQSVLVLQPFLSKNASLVYPSQPNRPALDNINTIYPGEFVFVIGNSGSGKSSLLRLLSRVRQKATHGQVIVAGRDLTLYA